MLTIAAAKAVRLQGRRHVRLAASVEFMHTARCCTTMWSTRATTGGRRRPGACGGNQASVLSSALPARPAFRMMVEVGSLPALKILSGAAANHRQGEVMQQAAAKEHGHDEDEYLAIIERQDRRAVLTARGGCASPTAGQEQAALKSSAAISALPSSSSTTRSTIPASAPASEGDHRATIPGGQDHLPVILCFRRGGDEERAFWRRTLARRRGGRRSRPRHQAHEEAQRDRGDTERARHYGAIAAMRWHLPRDAHTRRARRRDRLLHQPGPIEWCAPFVLGPRSPTRPELVEGRVRGTVWASRFDKLTREFYVSLRGGRTLSSGRDGRPLVWRGAGRGDLVRKRRSTWGAVGQRSVETARQRHERGLQIDDDRQHDVAGRPIIARARM